MLRIFRQEPSRPAFSNTTPRACPFCSSGLESKTLSEQQIFDLGLNFIRTQLATVQGAAVPLPFGGKFRQVMVDLNPEALYAKQLSPADVSNALNQQSLILPAGDAKIGDMRLSGEAQQQPDNPRPSSTICPIKVVNGATVYMKDVAQVRDGYAVQTSIVRDQRDARRAAHGAAERQGFHAGHREEGQEALPKILAGLPPELQVRQLFDQSLFVRAAIGGVVREAVIAACLTGLMILLFLGSWRSTVIVCISIPLSILTSLIILSLIGQTINVMTLGGLALAVGILVDDATVEIENTHRNMAMKKPLVRAVLDGAQQIAVPAFVSTLAICIVFVPVLLLTGAAKYLFTPLAMAVVFAMLASYLLSRTLIPTMVHYMLKPEVKLYVLRRAWRGGGRRRASSGACIMLSTGASRGCAPPTPRLLDWALDHRGAGVGRVPVFSWRLAVPGTTSSGRTFFPTVDSGQIAAARPGAGGHAHRENGADLRRHREAKFAHVIPPREIDTIIDNIGIPFGGFNLAFGDSTTIGTDDGDILISLKTEEHGPTAEYTERLRKRLHEKFPDVTFLLRGGQHHQPDPELRPAGAHRRAGGGTGRRRRTTSIAEELQQRIARIPGAADVHIHQVVNYPEMRVNVDRSKAGQLGLTQRDVSNSLLISLSSSGQVAPTQWLNWTNGVTYSVAVQTPQYRLNSVEALMRTPITALGPAVHATRRVRRPAVRTRRVRLWDQRRTKRRRRYGNPGRGTFRDAIALQSGHHRARRRRPRL